MLIALSALDFHVVSLSGGGGGGRSADVPGGGSDRPARASCR